MEDSQPLIRYSKTKDGCQRKEQGADQTQNSLIY